MYFGLNGGGAARLGGPADEPGWPQLLNGYVFTSSSVVADLAPNPASNTGTPAMPRL
jgi:hypothetical protein